MTRGEKVCACRYIRPWWIANIRKEQGHFQMNIETVKELLIENEGMVLHCYKDHLGLDPIGVGRLIHEGKGGLTEEEAKYLLENDIGRVIDRLDRNFP